MTTVSKCVQVLIPDDDDEEMQHLGDVIEMQHLGDAIDLGGEPPVAGWHCYMRCCLTSAQGTHRPNPHP